MAAGSLTGGSGFLLSLCARSLLRGAVSQVVLLEAERNIAAKLSSQVLNRYHQLLQTVPLVVAAVPPLSAQEPWLPMVNAKDAHVLAAALTINAGYLLTLDQRLVAEVRRFHPAGVAFPRSVSLRALIGHPYPRYTRARAIASFLPARHKRCVDNRKRRERRPLCAERCLLYWLFAVNARCSVCFL
jgi:hypothetical protein